MVPENTVATVMPTILPKAMPMLEPAHISYVAITSWYIGGELNERPSSEFVTAEWPRIA